MSTTHAPEVEIPADTFELRRAIARFHAGNLSAAEAASRVGVTGQAWRNWESGKSVGARRPAMLAYIAQQLGVSEDWLRFGGELKRAPHPDGPNGGLSVVRREGLEPPTQWFSTEDVQILSGPQLTDWTVSEAA